jgi:hypothetical protein
MKMTTGTKRTFTRQQVARFKAINASKQGKNTQTETPKGEGEGQVVKMKTFVLQGVEPFDAMIGFTETSRGMTKGDESRPFTTLKGVGFTVDGKDYVRTCMAFGPASDAINGLLDAGETTLEVQLTPNYNTMRITGVVVDGTFMSFPDERPVEGEVRKAA